MSRKLRDKTEVSWNRLVPRTVGRAWFNVALAFVALGLLVFAVIAYPDGLTWRTGVTYGLALLVVLALIPRSIAGLVILRREAARDQGAGAASPGKAVQE